MQEKYEDNVILINLSILCWKSYSKYLICISNINPVILRNCTLVILLCFARRMWMWLGVQSKEEEKWRKCYLQLGILKLLVSSFYLYPFSSAHTFNILLALLELRIYTYWVLESLKIWLMVWSFFPEKCCIYT